MAKKKKKRTSSKRSSMTAADYKKALTAMDNQTYQAALSKLMLSDIGKKATKTYTNYTKDLYRRYIENPSSNESSIRAMSNFLYRVSMPYRRLINYMSDIPLFYWNLIPQIDSTGNVSADKIIKNYYKILQLLEIMSIDTEMRKVLNTVLREGVFYGFIYSDKNSFFIHKLDPDYCRIIEMEAGCFNFAFDLSYFDKYSTYLEYMDPYFTTLFNLYKKDTNNYRWQLIDPTRSICIKVDADILDEILPQFIGIFEALLDLIDARTLQRNKDEIQNYKLIIQKIPAFDDTKEVDDFSLDMNTAVRFYQKLSDVVPEAVGIALSPMDIETIDFQPDDNSNDLIAASMRSVFSDSGVAQLLFNTDGSGSVGLDASIKVDTGLVWKLVDSIERWINRYILYNSSGTSRYFFEILRVDIFNKDAACTRELALANSGVPNKLKLAATSGISPYETLSAQIFENEMLKIHESWLPLQTSYTMSGDETDDKVDGDSIETEPTKDSTAKNQDRNANDDEVQA